MAEPDSSVDPPADFTACPHWGQGGRYVLNPETGQRVPVSEMPVDPLPATPAVSAKKGK